MCIYPKSRINKDIHLYDIHCIRNVCAKTKCVYHNYYCQFHIYHITLNICKQLCQHFKKY